MQASRRSTDNVPAKKRYKHPSPKRTKKIREQQLLYDLAKDIFRRNLKSVDVKTKYRRKENLFKITIKGFDSITGISRLQEKLGSIIEGNYKFSFCGNINPKTGKEDVLIYVTVYNQEGNYEAERIVTARECSNTERFHGVFGQTEIRLHTSNYAG